MTVLVLCHGNICRSPLAAAVMRRAGLTDVITAGFKPPTEKPKPCPKKVRDWALENEGLDLSAHRSQSVTVEMLREAEVILYADSGQLGRIDQIWKDANLDAEIGTYHAKTRPLGAFLAKQSPRIGDPMFQKPGTAEFLEIMHQLVEASGRFAEYWKAQKAGDAEVAQLRAEATASTAGAAGEEAAA